MDAWPKVSFQKIATSAMMPINWARGSRFLRLDALNPTMVLRWPDFAWSENPYSEALQTLNFNNGEIAYNA